MGWGHEDRRSRGWGQILGVGGMSQGQTSTTEGPLTLLLSPELIAKEER